MPLGLSVSGADKNIASCERVMAATLTNPVRSLARRAHAAGDNSASVVVGIELFPDAPVRGAAFRLLMRRA